MEDELYTMIEQLIDAAFDTKLGTKKTKEKTMDTQVETAPQEELTTVDESYESIEAYTERTGKRFRMLKEQKSRGLTREEAFAELHGGTD